MITGKRYLKRQQKRLARQKKGSKRREKTKGKIAKAHGRIANVRDNFCHQTSHALTQQPGKVIVMEDLKTLQMTKRVKPKKNPETGKWEKNRAAQKSGLNRSILSVGWYKLEQYTRYKAKRRGSLLIKISPQFSSQECADCSHIHSANRVSQALFVCQQCGNRDNADHNAALVLKKRAINLLKHSGSELSAKGVLSLPDTGRGVHSKTSKPKARKQGLRSVKKDGDATAKPEALAL
jgi:putative transposase